MMGRSAAFYSPLVWSGAFGASNSKQSSSSYSNSSGALGSSGFAYPPTPPKDDRTPDHQVQSHKRFF